MCRSSGRWQSSRSRAWDLPPFTNCSCRCCLPCTGCPSRSGGRWGWCWDRLAGRRPSCSWSASPCSRCSRTPPRSGPCCASLTTRSGWTPSPPTVLSFVARRLLADPVGMLFAIRETAEPHPSLQALPALRVTGLPEQDAYELLAAAVARPVHPDVAARIVAETEGNPLAIVEAAAGMTTEQLRGHVPLPEPLPVGHRLEDLFTRRVRDLPPTRGRCSCWRPQSSRAKAIGCGGRPPRWTSRSSRRRRLRRPVWRPSGQRCASPTRSSGRRSTTPRPPGSGVRPTGPSRRRATLGSTRSRAPGTWPRPRQGRTKGSRPRSRRRRTRPGAAVDTPPRPHSSNARRC